jgi:hypothetical protein
MAIADQHTRASNFASRSHNNWLILGSAIFAAIALAALIYLGSGGPEMDPSQLVGP